MYAGRLSRKTRHPCSGFTWVELVVSLAIIGLLAALLLPAVRQTRPTARRAQCQNNLRNVSTAMQAYATTRQGELPPLTGGFQIADPSDQVKGGGNRDAPWSVVILPYVEQSTLQDRLRMSPGWDRPSDVDLQRLAQTSIECYICPDTLNPVSGGLSYVANAGIIAEDSWWSDSAESFDFGFNGYGAENRNDDDAELAYATGVFWRVPVGTKTETGTPAPLNLDQISARDGTSQTILLSENLNTRSYDSVSGSGGWISDDTGDIAFGIAVPGTREGTAFRVALSDTAGGLGVAGGAQEAALALSEKPVPLHCRINANLKNAVNGRSPRPSSNHDGAVNMVFADGSCRVISEKIDLSVYARLLSPMGGRYGQSAVSFSDF